MSAARIAIAMTNSKAAIDPMFLADGHDAPPPPPDELEVTRTRLMTMAIHGRATSQETLLEESSAIEVQRVQLPTETYHGRATSADSLMDEDKV